MKKIKELTRAKKEATVLIEEDETVGEAIYVYVFLSECFVFIMLIWCDGGNGFCQKVSIFLSHQFYFGLHFGSKKTGKISIVFLDDLSRNFVFFRTEVKP